MPHTCPTVPASPPASAAELGDGMGRRARGAGHLKHSPGSSRQCCGHTGTLTVPYMSLGVFMCVPLPGVSM